MIISYAASGGWSKLTHHMLHRRLSRAQQVRYITCVTGFYTCLQGPPAHLWLEGHPQCCGNSRCQAA